MLNKYYSIYLLTFISGLYSGFSKFSFSMLLKFTGLNSAKTATIMNFILLPFAIKLLWVPFLEMINPGKYGHKKSWILFLDFLSLILTFGFIFFNFKQIDLYFLSYVIFYTTVISTRESVALGYQIQMLEKAEIAKKQGIVNAWYNVGIWLTGPLFFMATDYFEWSSLFLVLSLCFALLFCMTIFIQDVQNELIAENISLQKLFQEPFSDFLKNNKNCLFVLVIFIAFYRLQDRLTMSGLYLFFVDKGFSKFDIGFLTLGTFMRIVGGLGSSYLIKKFGYKFTLIFSVLLHSIVCLMLIFPIFVNKSYFILFFFILFEKLAQGFESNSFSAYQLTFFSKKFASSQVSIFLAFEKLTAIIIGFVANLGLEYFSWNFFFLFAIFSCLPAIFALKKLPS